MRQTGTGLAWSFFTKGRLELTMDQPFDSLTAYEKAIQLCLLEKQSTVPISALQAEIAFVQTIDRGREMPEPHAWVSELLRLGEAVWKGEKPVGLSAKRASFAQPVVILAGGTGRAFQANIDRFRQAVLEAFKGFGGRSSRAARTRAWPD